MNTWEQWRDRALMGLDGGGMKPQFTHNCTDCVFIGHYGDYDIYRCPQMGMPTIVARWGNDGPEYTSGRAIEIDDLTLSLRVSPGAYVT